MSLTRDQIAATVLANLEDAGLRFFSASDVNSSIQDAYDDICCYCGQIEKSKTVAYVSNLVYYDAITLIPDFMAATAVYNYNTKLWLLDSSTRELDQIRWDWELWHGEAQWFSPHDFRYLIVCPTLTSASGNMEIFYKASANLLVGSDIPLIKGPTIKVLEYYATGDLLESVKEYNKADIWLAEYVRIREDYKVENKALSSTDRMFMIQQNSMRGMV